MSATVTSQSPSYSFSHRLLPSSPLSHSFHSLSFPTSLRFQTKFTFTTIMASNSKLSDTLRSPTTHANLDHLASVANELADASGQVICQYFRKKFEILDKDDLTPVTIADRAAEDSMVSIIWDHFPSHAIYGEEKGWRCKQDFADYVWVLDPIDGTKSFMSGRPLFGTLIALLHMGEPILGIIDQPILRERWIGISGRRTTLNREELSTRTCASLSQAISIITRVHPFGGDTEEAKTRAANKVKMPLHGCDCYAYALLASGFVDLVIESKLQPYDFLALIPVVEGAGGIITDWKGDKLRWDASPDSPASRFNAVAAGDKRVHRAALEALEWH